MLRQITFFRVSRVPKQCSGISNVSNAWINMWNKMIEEKAGFERQNSKKGFQRRSMPAAWREFLWFQFECQSVFKGGRPYLENSKLAEAQTGLKVTSRNPGHAAGAHWLGNFEGLWHCEEHVKTMFFLQWQARVEWQNDEQNTLFLRWQARVEWQNDQQKHSFCAGKLERSCRMISKTHSFCAGKLEWIGRMISKTQTFCAGKLEWIGRMISKNTLFGKLEWSG